MNFLGAWLRMWGQSFWFWIRALSAIVVAAVGGALLSNLIGSIFGLSADNIGYLTGLCFFVVLVAEVKIYEHYHLWRFFDR